MLRVTIDSDVRGSVVRIAGQLTVELLAEVERSCLSAELPVLIDASGLQGSDEDGLALLARLRDGGVRVEGLSEYLEIRVRVCKERNAVDPGDSGGGHDGPGPSELA